MMFRVTKSILQLDPVA